MKMECSCSQGFHEAPVKVLEVSENAIEKVPMYAFGFPLSSFGFGLNILHLFSVPLTEV